MLGETCITVGERIEPQLETHQFTDKKNRSTEEAVLSIDHPVSKHDEKRRPTRVLFVDFTSAFDPVQIQLVPEKPLNMLLVPF